MVYVSVVWAVACEQAPGCRCFLGRDGESLVRLLAKSLADSMLGKAAAAAAANRILSPNLWGLGWGLALPLACFWA